MSQDFIPFFPDESHTVYRARKQRLELFYLFTCETANLLLYVSSEKAFQLVNDLTFAATRRRLDPCLYGSDFHIIFPYFIEAIHHLGEILHGKNVHRISVAIYEITRQINFYFFRFPHLECRIR